MNISTYNKYTCLSISLFCDHEHWGALYENSLCIINSHVRFKLMLIKLNIDKCNQIDLEIKVEFAKRYRSSNTIDKILKNGLEKIEKASFIKVAPYDQEPLFMPFPENSVQYGLFPPDKGFLKIRCYLGKINENLLVNRGSEREIFEVYIGLIDQIDSYFNFLFSLPIGSDLGMSDIVSQAYIFSSNCPKNIRIFNLLITDQLKMLFKKDSDGTLSGHLLFIRELYVAVFELVNTFIHVQQAQKRSTTEILKLYQ